ncbi:MAG: TonB-dependent receptor plug domain-containing protein, partial [Flavobacteriales bacterium]
MKHSSAFIKSFFSIYSGCSLLLLTWIPVLFFTNLTTVTAQDSYSGKVTDSRKEPLAGVAIQLQNTRTGTTTDTAGAFQLTAAPGDILVISFTGYNSKEITLGSEKNLTVVLEDNLGLLGEVVVVGSRGLPRTVTSSPVPVDAINIKELKSFAQVNVSDILNYLAPSFNSNRQTVTDGTDHLDPASLRGLGPDQVLVLVNGKRRHTSALVNINGAVARGSVGTDMNVIPVAAIERVEILRDGAAAQYGSDAIAGVINVVLKKNYNGLSASLTNGMHITNLKYKVPNMGGGFDQKSQTLYDGGVVQFDLSKGFRLGKKGSLTITTQYNERGKTNRSGLDNAPTIYLGSSGGFPATPAGQNQTDFRTQLITDDATLVAANNYDRHNMVFGNSSSRNIGLFLNGIIPVKGKSELYFAGGYTYRSGKAYGNNRVPVSRAQQPLNADGSLYYPNG